MNDIKQYKNLIKPTNHKNKKEIIDNIVRIFFLITTLISASFIILIIVFISIKGIVPFVTNNNGIGRVNIITFLTGNVWLTGTAFQSSLYSVGFIIINTLYISFLALMISMMRVC